MSKGQVVLSDDGRIELDALLHTAVERRAIPGVVAIVANSERVLYRGAFGKLDEQGAIDMPADAIFQIASMTKPVTSVAILMLREQGLLDLDDPVSRYIPDLVGKEVLDTFNKVDASYTTRPAKREVTIRHLLTHTAGFGYPFANEILSILHKGGERAARDLPLLHDPGSQWTYSMGTDILGDVIVRITGMPLGDFFEARIIQPLDLDDTGFALKPEKIGRLAALFRRVGDRLIGEPRPEAYESSVGGDAGLLATADDYVRFLQMLLGMGQLGSTRLLSHQSVTELTTNQIGSLKVQRQPGAIPDLSNAFPLGAGEDTFSLGFQLKGRQGENTRSSGSYSWAGLFNTHFWVDPKQGIAAVLMMQVLPFYDDRCILLLTDFEKHVYQNVE